MARDRIVELVRVPAGELELHPRNWRRHSPRQRELLQAVLGELGWADALLARRKADGRLQLLDGHLRAELARDEPVPVLVLDLDSAEGESLLAVLDPLAALAEAEAPALESLAANLAFHDPVLAGWLEELTTAAHAAQLSAAEESGPERPEGGAVEIPASWQVVVECADEAEQRALYEQLTAAGHRVRVLTL